MVVFDIDDTLYNELDYIWSSYQKISKVLNLDISAEMLAVRRQWKDVFQYVKDTYNTPMSADEIAQMYWDHTMTLELFPDAKRLLDWLKTNHIKTGIISDGRSLTQRNKMKMLGLNDYVANDDVVISEEIGNMKPCIDNYLYFEKRYPDTRFVYIGDNTERDFLSPNQLGWDSFCRLDAGRNIHPQNFCLPNEYLPKHTVKSLDECIPFFVKEQK